MQNGIERDKSQTCAEPVVRRRKVPRTKQRIKQQVVIEILRKAAGDYICPRM